MPKKLVDTSPRRWGTRFDSLVPATASPSTPQTELSSPSTATPQLAHQGRRDLPKLPHDASVFVGSLPSAMDHRELIRALYDHLSPYAEIHNIKVVRDPRHGGVCAFVQCEVCVPPCPFFVMCSDRAISLRRALLSLSLPSTLNLPHHSLVVPSATRGLGPYEPFSYHTGLWFLHPDSVLFTSHSAPTMFTAPDPSLGGASATGSLSPIDPATAMRLYKTQGARYVVHPGPNICV